MLNHLEYDNRSLADEYERDIKAGLDTAMPVNLFPDNDPTGNRRTAGAATASLLFQNWINEIYQTTPYDIEAIGRH
jgi:homoserine O-succinyltransferase